MEPSEEQQDQPSRLTVGMADIAIAALFIALGSVVIYDSNRIGSGWAPDGPQSGYFPFYIGWLMTISGVVVFLQTLRGWVAHRAWFATRKQLGRVYSVLFPSAAYVALIYVLGIYVASALFIAWFMVRQGKFGWLATLPVSIGIPIVFFMLFDRWFLVPLPKGPLEHLLGF